MNWLNEGAQPVQIFKIEQIGLEKQRQFSLNRWQLLL